MPMNFADAFQSALRHLQAGRMVEAETACRQALDAHPGHADALHLLGYIALRQGQVAAAVDQLTEAARRAPESPHIHHELGRAFLAQDNFVGAEACFRRTLTLGPRLASAHVSLGMLFLQNRRHDEAAAALQDAIRLEPGNSDSHAMLGDTLRAAGKLAPAVAAYRRALDIEPRHLGALINLGQTLLVQDQARDAAAAFTTALAQRHDVLPALVGLSEACRAIGDLAGTAEVLRRALALRPDMPELHNNLGLALAAFDDIAAATACFERAIALNPSYADAHFNLGNLHARRHLFGAAAQALEKALALKPSDIEVRRNLGIVLRHLGRADEAQAIFRGLVREAPDNPGLNAQLARTLIATGDDSGAELAAQAALALQPDNPLALHAAGLCAMTQARLEDAHLLLSRARRAAAEATLTQRQAHAERCLNDGSPAAAEILARITLKHFPADEAATSLVERAVSTLRDEAACANRRSGRSGRPRYLLSAAWGCGFWSDVMHVLGCLLLAEITGRIPIVHWGRNSRFSSAPDENAFTRYFEPVSAASIDMIDRDDDFPATLPGAANRSPASRLAALDFLFREEATIVCSNFVNAIDLLAYIPPQHELRGLTPMAVLQRLAAKFLRPSADVRAEIEAFTTAHLAAGPYIAVHVRGSDKVGEIDYLACINRAYFPVLDRLAAAASDAMQRIFLLSDSDIIVDQFRQRFGARLIIAPCQRTRGDIGLHYLPNRDRWRLGMEVMRDTYAAARADWFVGNGASGPSVMAQVLANRQAERVRLVFPNVLLEHNPGLYLPQSAQTRSFMDPAAA